MAGWQELIAENGHIPEWPYPIRYDIENEIHFWLCKRLLLDPTLGSSLGNSFWRPALATQLVPWTFWCHIGGLSS